MASSSLDKPRKWSELPPELISSIMLRLGVVEILENAQKVCSSWRRVSQDPSMWRKIDMRDTEGRREGYEQNFDRICRIAVDRSEGGLVEIKLGKFTNASLLNYVADRSSNLRSLTLDLYSINNDEIQNAVSKLPLLEELEVSSWALSKLNLKAIGHSCPLLKTLKLDFFYYLLPCKGDDDALAIAEAMPQLRHLELIGNGLTEIGLNAILDNCPHLRHLDLRKCYLVNLVGDLEKRCLERMKVFKLSNHSIYDYPFNFNSS